MPGTIGIDATKIVVKEAGDMIEKAVLALKDGAQAEDIAVVPSLITNIMKIMAQGAKLGAEFNDLDIKEWRELYHVGGDELFDVIEALKGK